MSSAKAFDAVVVGAGHNGLTCAAYLAAAGHVRVRGGASRGGGRRCGHRGVSSGLSQLHRELHGKPPRSAGDPRPAPRAARPGGARASVLQLPSAGLEAGDGYLKVGGGLEATQAEVAKFSRKDAQALPAYYAMLDRVAAILRGVLHATPPNVGGGTRADVAFAVEALKASKGFRALDLAGAPRPARPLHQERRRSARPLVRERADQGRVRIRCGGGQLREPLHAGLGVRAPASRLRRGERQAGTVGTRGGRHGRDHAGDGRGVRVARRRHPHERPGGARDRRGRTRVRRRARRRRGRSPRARVVANVNPEAPLRSPGAARARARRFPRAHRGLSLRLGNVPHERRARCIAGFHRAAHCRRDGAPQPHHASGIIMAPSLAYMERAYFDAKTHGWSRAPIVEILIPVDGGRLARAARASTWRASSASTCIRTSDPCSRAAPGTMRATRSPTSWWRRSIASRPASARACSGGASSRRSTSSANSASSAATSSTAR